MKGVLEDSIEALDRQYLGIYQPGPSILLFTIIVRVCWQARLIQMARRIFSIIS